MALGPTEQSNGSLGLAKVHRCRNTGGRIGRDWGGTSCFLCGWDPCICNNPLGGSISAKAAERTEEELRNSFL